MTAWRSGVLLAPLALVLAPVLALVLALVTPAYAADDPVPSRTLFTFEDDDVFESSGLVDRGAKVYTINDSGDDAVVYGVDTGTGRTVSRTTYAEEVSDVEALAPGGDGTVWAADIGDNRRSRDDITVHRVQLADGERPGAAYRLSYPDGAHDAEALLVHPRTKRVLVVSKSPFGGTVYAAPRDLDPGLTPNRMRAVAQVSGLVTDGAFLPDAEHVVLRTYTTASVYTYPAFELVGTVRLPSQRQGEAISVSPAGRVLVSTEGVRADVLQVRLPTSLTSPPADGAAGSPAPAPQTPAPRSDEPERNALDWAGIAAVSAVVALLGWLTLRGSRVRGPRRG